MPTGAIDIAAVELGICSSATRRGSTLRELAAAARGEEPVGHRTPDPGTLAQPLRGPGIGIGVSIGGEEGVGQKIFHDRIIGSVALEILDPTETRIDLVRLQPFRRRAHGITDEAPDEGAMRPIDQACTIGRCRVGSGHS
jgi:hypothetical protein